MNEEDEKEFYHVLGVLSEECSEIIQIISKINRFGLNSSNPISGISNIESLNNEYNDFLGTLELLKYIDLNKYSECFNEDLKKVGMKFSKVRTMMEISRQCNRL